jgi:hypothetical protein
MEMKISRLDSVYVADKKITFLETDDGKFEIYHRDSDNRVGLTIREKNIEGDLYGRMVFFDIDEIKEIFEKFLIDIK